MNKRGLIFHAVGFCLLSFFLGSCHFAGKEGLGSDTPQTLSGKMIPVGTFAELPLDLSGEDWAFAGQSSLYYIERNRNPEENSADSTLCIWNEDSNTPMVTGEESEEDFVYFGFSDKNENIYTFGQVSVEGINHFYLRKYGSDGSRIEEKWFDLSEISVLQGTNLSGGAVDGDGNICLYDWMGNLYFFDQQIQLVSKTVFSREERANETQSRFELISTGAGDVYAYYFTFTSGGPSSQHLIYCKVNMKEGRIEKESRFISENGIAVKLLWRGSGNSVLYADADTLWELHLTDGTARPILALDGDYINIDGSYIKAVSRPMDGRISIYLYDPQTGISEYAVVSDQDIHSIPAKETVTIGLIERMSADTLIRYVKRFNRQSDQWVVKVVDYCSIEKNYDNYLDEYIMDILKGNAPDLLEVKAIPFELIENNNLLSSLEPFFQKSQKVRQEDILPSVWNSGCLNGEITMIMPWFRINSVAVKKETLEERPWNLDTFLWLLNTDPDKEMISPHGSIRSTKLLELALEANGELFYNRQTKECFFGGEEFRELLKSIKEAVYGKKESDLTTWDSRTLSEDYINGNTLLLETFFVSIDNMLRMQRDYDTPFNWAGYPSEEGEYHKFNAEVLLGINGASQVKEGAWAFLEYLLTQEIQTWSILSTFAFPVRIKEFDQYLASTYTLDANKNAVYATKEECAQFRRIVDNAFLPPLRIFDPINKIIHEEAQYYFTDAKSLEQTIEVIQNRVTLYLSE